MSRFKKIHVCMYGDEKYRSLSKPQPNGQSLWNYLLTGPHTTAIPGLSYIGQAALAEALEWPLEGFTKAFQEVSQKGMAEADWTARVVWVPNGIKYNPPESPNVIKAWGKAWEEIPECELKTKAYAGLKAFVEGLGEGFRKAFREGIPQPARTAFVHPSGNQEQEQEQEQKKKKHAASPPDNGGSLSGPSPKVPKPASDERRKPLIDFLFTDYKTRTGMNLAVPFKGGVQALTVMLKETRGDPTYDLEQLKSAWVALMETEDPFIQKQNPVRYFAQNVTNFLSHHPPDNGGPKKAPEPVDLSKIEPYQEVVREVEGQLQLISKMTQRIEARPGLIEKACKARGLKADNRLYTIAAVSLQEAERNKKAEGRKGVTRT